jgi:hypothetical protein
MKDTREIYYGMYTEAGNQAVHAIFEQARINSLSWLEVYQELVNLADIEGFGEATDTMVREYVYSALGFGSDFYV